VQCAIFHTTLHFQVNSVAVVWCDRGVCNVPDLWTKVGTCRPPYVHALAAASKCSQRNDPSAMTLCIQRQIGAENDEVVIIIQSVTKSRYRKDDGAMRPIYECPENCL